MTARPAMGGFVIALAIVAVAVFAGVAIHELQYASDHPHQDGPARVIAWCSGGGVVASAAVELTGYCLVRGAADSAA
jgi:hypothetical protein